jgi:ABC-2 type transport system permease protein
LPWLLVTVPSGVLIFYSFRFFFSASAVIFTRAENLQYLWYHLYKLGLRPDNIYFPWLKYLILTAIPVGLIASAPARVVLGIAEPWLALWAACVAGLSLYGSSRFWKFALSRYTSASS